LEVAVVDTPVELRASDAASVPTPPSEPTTAATLVPVTPGISWKGWLEASQQITAILANLVVVAGTVGVVLAYRQWQDAKRAEITQAAITAMSQTRTPEFLKAYSRLVRVQRHPADATPDSDDVDYVVNTYDQIALLYLNGVVDRCLVKRAIEDALQTLSPLWANRSDLKKSTVNIESMRQAMQRARCE
jgi:hypothetical protein